MAIKIAEDPTQVARILQEGVLNASRQPDNPGCTHSDFQRKVRLMEDRGIFRRKRPSRKKVSEK